MTTKSGIEWTATVHEDGSVTQGSTWSPVSGCTKQSAGCKNCYAEREVETRWSKNPRSIWYGRKFTDIQLHVDQLDKPISWKTGRKIFVCPRADLFHESVPDTMIDKVFAVMAITPQHTYQVLTKRAARLHAYLTDPGRKERIAAVIASMALANPKIRVPGWEYPLRNVWVGVSAENQETYDERIQYLEKIPAAVRWLSLEPLLGDIFLDLTDCMGHPLNRVDWVVVGGESGSEKDARPMDPNWVRYLRDQCIAARLPFYFKQWGAWYRTDKGMEYVGKKQSGCELDGKVWHQYPSVKPAAGGL